MLTKIGIPYEKAIDHAHVSLVYEDGRRFLPYGFHQSPVLSSLALDKSAAGQFLRKIDRDVSISVYVDDVILSSRERDSLMRATQGFTSALEEANFSINEEKTVLCGRKCNSFNVKLQSGSTEIVADRMNQFKLQIEESKGNGYVIQGILNYVFCINPEQAKELAADT